MFGDRESGRCLAKFARTKIVVHQLVIKDASVDDPAPAEYWASRRHRNKPPLSPSLLHMLQQQQGRCPSAKAISCMPTDSRKAPKSGNSGCGRSEWRCAAMRRTYPTDRIHLLRPGRRDHSRPRPGSGPHQLTVALQTAREHLQNACGVLDDTLWPDTDFARILTAEALPVRRPRISTRKVKCSVSRYHTSEDNRPLLSSRITAIMLALQQPPAIATKAHAQRSAGKPQPSACMKPLSDCGPLL
ncbi:hypothetical protein ACH4VR_28070 [Streptomyces sp. NPDC020883]|uniref:hypothetical protein n=1 Tax=Streptomyces sp. NPDC020883 TaxID=3365099 RepID=UPI0037ADBB6E